MSDPDNRVPVGPVGFFILRVHSQSVLRLDFENTAIRRGDF